MRATFDDVVDFVCENRRRDAFVGYSRDDIEVAIRVAASDRTLVYATSENGDVLGIALGRKIGPKSIYVDQILTTQKGVLADIVRWLSQHYPDYNLTAKRHNREVVINASGLIKRLAGKN